MLDEKTDIYKYSKESNTVPHCLGYTYMHDPASVCEQCGFAFDCKIIYEANLKKGKIKKNRGYFIKEE